MWCDMNVTWILSQLLFFFFSPIDLITGPGQEESSGGDQSLHHSVPGQRSLPDQCLSQQCTAAAGHPGITAAAHGVLHQPHFSGQRSAAIWKHSCNKWWPTFPTSLFYFHTVCVIWKQCKAPSSNHGFLYMSLSVLSMWQRDRSSVCPTIVLLSSSPAPAHWVVSLFTIESQQSVWSLQKQLLLLLFFHYVFPPLFSFCTAVMTVSVLFFFLNIVVKLEWCKSWILTHF